MTIISLGAPGRSCGLIPRRFTGRGVKIKWMQQNDRIKHEWQASRGPIFEKFEYTWYTGESFGSSSAILFLLNNTRTSASTHALEP